MENSFFIVTNRLLFTIISPQCFFRCISGRWLKTKCQILFWFVVVAIQKKTLKIIFSHVSSFFKSVTTLNFKSINFVGYEDQADLRKNVTLMFENVQLCEKADIKGRGDNQGKLGVSKLYHGMFLEWWNTTKSLSTNLQCFSCLLDEGNRKNMYKKFNYHGGFLRQTKIGQKVAAKWARLTVLSCRYICSSKRHT